MGRTADLKVCAIVFGDGSENFKSAAQRVGKQARELNLFEQVRVLDSDSLAKISKRYSEDLPKIQKLTSHPLYFRAIKPWAILSALEFSNNLFDIVFYLDAGCELPNNYVSKIRLKKLFRRVHKVGAIAERTMYAENDYSRKNLIDAFGSEIDLHKIGQIQSTWSMFSNSNTNRRFMADWIEFSDPKYDFWQDPSPEQLSIQNPGFIENRWDQSIFSILYKKYELPTKKTYWEYGGRFGAIRGLSVPIHASRNKSGHSRLPKFHENDVLALFSFTLNFLMDVVRPMKNKIFKSQH